MDIKLINKKVENIQSNLYKIQELISVTKDSCAYNNLFEQETILEIIYCKLDKIAEQLDYLNINLYSEILK